MSITSVEHPVVGGRHQPYGMRELRRLIDPRSIAIVGASPKPGSFGRRTRENIGAAYQGAVYPVNPRYKEVEGRACYPSLEALPEVPDCIILAVPGSQVLDQLERAAQLGVGGAIIYSSGFAEIGTSEAASAQTRITELAQRTGLRVLGPNCAGIANLTSSVGLTFMPKFYEMNWVRGPIGLVSQSGGMGYVVLQGMQRGLGFSHFLSAGNSCDVDVCDLVNYLVDEPSTRVIICMMEGVKDGARFMAAAERALKADKPLLVFKMGNSAIARTAAMSHTGTLIGSAAYKWVFERLGVIALDSFEQILESANFFAKAGRPSARGVCVVSPSGGAAVMAADIAEDLGIELPPPAPQTTERTSRMIPSFGSNTNPSDITAESVNSIEMYGECIKAFADDPSYSAVVVPMLSAHEPVGPQRARYLCDLAKDVAKPVCAVWLNEWLEGPGSRIYDGSERIATFRSMVRCMQALKLWIHHYDRRDELLRPPAPRLTHASIRAEAKAIVQGCGSVLSERESKRLLKAYGIPIAQEVLVDSEDAAVAGAQKIGLPVVMKVDSPDIPHKTEAGVVRIGVRTLEDVRLHYREILEAAARVERARINGVVIQEMVAGGAELMVGVTVDPQFGPLVTCGFGGVTVEVTADTATALPPVDMAQARRMIKSLRGYRLLTGYRKMPRLDVDAFAEVVCRISELASDLADEIAEIDANPVIVQPNRAVAVDALVVLDKDRESSTAAHYNSVLSY